MTIGTTVGGALAGTGLNSARKAEIIYAQARSELSNRLWQAALGTNGDGAQSDGGKSALPMSLDSLLALLDTDRAETAIEGSHGRPSTSQASQGEKRDIIAHMNARADSSGFDEEASRRGSVTSVEGRGYGPNARYAGVLGDAARRTGIPSAALATIVHAEAAKGKDGRWLPYARNPRSSAAGLGQFLSGTWVGEAERRGTWLNQIAQERGWLSGNGRVRGESKGALLSLRYDPDAAIQAIADYARSNLDGLQRAGIDVSGDAQSVAQMAYLGHHLGQGDAVRFLKAGLSPDRARTLLNAQIGAANATRRINDAGNATVAHRSWLLNYVGKHIRPDRFEV